MQPVIANTASSSPKDHPTLDALVVDPPVVSTAAPVPEQTAADAGQADSVLDASVQMEGVLGGASDDDSSDDGSDGDDDDGSDGDAKDTVPSQATEESAGAGTVQAANGTGVGAARITGRKRPRDPSAVAQPMRKRQYVNSVRAIDGVRRHVTVTCTRLAVGGFKCTFTSEHRRLSGALRCQRANAKGGEVIERRHDAFLITGPAGHDAPFPDYDRVRENFLVRGTDICEHVRSELIPTHSKATATTAAAVAAPVVVAAAAPVASASMSLVASDAADVPPASSS
ncbi:hypothetical protein TW95_gp1678 [Pandoravirus inopinatum]|uniref:Uncharacterized protein n=1 Tax=Pandoravirus inopinatum TaxID=1605721 RepID=A0A0B5JF07_9VIRU|nr:hypothetical protein TW95_gp1678 [Pandoravirus inopinatum]AJF98412.1 hypothetical protein [Pandoravirus inopinatum]